MPTPLKIMISTMMLFLPAAQRTIPVAKDRRDTKCLKWDSTPILKIFAFYRLIMIRISIFWEIGQIPGDNNNGWDIHETKAHTSDDTVGDKNTKKALGYASKS